MRCCISIYTNHVSMISTSRRRNEFSMNQTRVLTSLWPNELIWLHSMMTSSNENFSALLAICAGNSPVTDEFPTPVTRSFDVFFDLRLNKWLSKQSWGWRLETPSRPLWHRCNGSVSALNWVMPCYLKTLYYVLTYTAVYIPLAVGEGMDGQLCPT